MTRALYRYRQNPLRSGITLLEVLISIGILAVGLASVVALVPAGRSQAARAVVLDRAAILAANVLADAATCGFLRPSSVTNGGIRPLVIDAAGAALIGGTNGYLGPLGIYSSAVPPTAAPMACQNMFLQLRDDVVVGAPVTPDAPSVNSFTDGARSFEGRMSALLCLQSGTLGGPDRMSVVVFHRRDPALLTLTGTLVNGTLTIPASQAASLGTRLVSDVIKPGVVVYSESRFHQVTSAWINTGTAVSPTSSGVYTAWLTFSTGTLGMAITTSATPRTLQFLPDSVGLAERPFTPETNGQYAQ